MVNQIPVADLKSATDPSIIYYPFKITIGTTRIQKDILNEFGMMCRTIIITNSDPNNPISIITVDPQSPADSIPPNTKGEQDQWTAYIDLVPNAVTGRGLLELWLVPLANAKKDNSPKANMLRSLG